jgi:hypothetical protein
LYSLPRFQPEDKEGNESHIRKTTDLNRQIFIENKKAKNKKFIIIKKENTPSQHEACEKKGRFYSSETCQQQTCE